MGVADRDYATALSGPVIEWIRSRPCGTIATSAQCYPWRCPLLDEAHGVEVGAERKIVATDRKIDVVACGLTSLAKLQPLGYGVLSI